MAILRSLIVRPSSISAICGILTEKETETVYVNTEYSHKMMGDPVDYSLPSNNGILVEQAEGFSFDSTGLLNGVYLLTHRDEQTKGKNVVAVGVKDNVLMVVADARGLIWTHECESTRSIQREALRKVMSPDNYDNYINRKVKSDLTLLF